MPRRFYVHRQHIISSLDSFLYQLHTLSFVLSPSLWVYVCRLIAQFQCSRPRELDSNRSLRFYYMMIILLNLPSVVKHSTRGAVDGRAFVLDFVGMSYTPSKFQLCFLDLWIIFLQMLLTTMAYETSVYYTSEDQSTTDMLLPESPHPSTLSIPLFQIPSDTASLIPSSSSYPPPQPKPLPSANALPFVMDVRFRSIITRIRNPPPPPRPTATDSMLPLPNTTTFPLPPGMRMLLRATGQMRSPPAPTPAATTGGREMRIPGAMDSGPD
ncbi:hypothetical protein CPB83DRAFT_852563, partial [Crepidotus variabilis]